MPSVHIFELLEHVFTYNEICTVADEAFLCHHVGGRFCLIEDDFALITDFKKAGDLLFKCFDFMVFDIHIRYISGPPTEEKVTGSSSDFGLVLRQTIMVVGIICLD